MTLTAISPDERPAPRRSVPSSAGRRWKAASSLALALLAAAPLSARADGPPVARDAETEALVQEYAKPIFAAAGIHSKTVQIFLIPNDAFNAFVTGPTKMFIFTGAITATKTPNELIGIIAHETGHLAHGDLAGLRQQLDSARTAAMIAGLLGMGAAVAGAATRTDGLGQAGAAISAGGMQVAMRNLLMYQRGQESGADRAAVDYLNRTGQSPAGLLATLKRLADDALLSSRSVDPYMQSHPLPADRVSALQSLVARSPYLDRKDPPALQLRHDLVRAKLAAFTWQPTRVARAYPMSDQSLPAKYARAIVVYRSGALAPAIKAIDGLIAAAPANPYFWELKGQAYLDAGRSREASLAYGKAVSLAPSQGLLRVLYGQALVAAGNYDEAIRNLETGLQGDPDSPAGYRALARAYAYKQNIPMAELASAQGFLAEGNVKDAKLHARRAQANLKYGSPAWLRADDIVSFNPPKKR
ncbi:MAG: M48 family metallopeptidase [Rhizobiales bacterium]|nr:M48 family metallopeptidase [Hyphomicrobiales bacterium]